MGFVPPNVAVLWSPCLAAPAGTDFIPPSVVIFFCAFPADNIGDRTSVLHSTPVRHPAFSWYLAIVFFLSFFFLFFKQTLRRLPQGRAHTWQYPAQRNKWVWFL